jgi:glycosyltransferase involved in cell wall biosynthesis
MKIIIDNSNLFAGGGLQVAVSFLNNLKEMDLAHEFHIIQSVKCAENFDASLFSKNFVFYNLSRIEENSKRKRKLRVVSIENSINPDCIFTLFGPSYHKSSFPKIVGFAIPYIIYPDSPFFKQLSVKDKVYYKLLIVLKTYCFKKYSDALIFETEDARKIFTKKVKYKGTSYVVGNTLNEIFFSKTTLPEFAISSSSSLNILLLTANYPHKNMHIVPEVIRLLKESHKFTDFKFLITLNKSELNFPAFCDNHIVYLGKVALEQIPSLYKQVQLVFIPTLLEVFSATYLEAMFMKKPIIASDLGFSRDICGNAALYCEATNPSAYAKAIVKLHFDSDLKDRLIKEGTENLKRFGTSLDRTQAYLSIIQNTLLSYENT